VSRDGPARDDATRWARLVCTADLHEHLPEIPAWDLLLIAGDVSFAFKGDLAAKHAFLEGPFADWLERAPASEIVLVAGNHDQSIEAWGVPDGLRCHYLEDAGIELCGLKVWGSPRGYGDRASDAANAPRVGSTALLETIERVQPRLVVCGHIHPGYGCYRHGATEIVNAAHVDNQYRPVNPVVRLVNQIDTNGPWP
jgi:hypothetical protein